MRITDQPDVEIGSLQATGYPMGVNRLGRYELVRLLGEGGQGQVHEAVLCGPGGFRKTVALKVFSDGEGLQREGRMGGLLRHPNLVDVYEVGEVGGTWFCAMEHCRGGSLRTHLPLSPKAALEVGLQICAALAYAHDELGLVHLDLKPENLLLDGGTVKVADLGIAKAEGFAEDPRIRGTPGYMSPEQRSGAPVDARADIYSLGIVLSELTRGVTPRAATTWVGDPVEAGSHPTEASWLRPIRDRLLDGDPARRFSSMREVAAALRDLSVDGDGLVACLGLENAPAVFANTNLLPESTRFVGRVKELARVEDALRTPSLTLIKGPGGIGKSRLARCAARRYGAQMGEEVWFCDVSDASDAAGILYTLAAALSVPLVSGAQDAQIRQLSYSLEGRGAPLLLFDTCEVVGAAMAVVAALHREAPNTRILCTSRHALQLGEHVLELGPMDTADAIALVTRRVLERGHEVRDEPAIAEIVERLDGVPMALELASSRIGVLSPREVLELLSLSWLRSGEPGLTARQATLRGTLDWSWNLLQPEDQAALYQLSVFRGGFTVEAAEVVLSALGHRFVLDRLQALIDQSWLAWRDERFHILNAAGEYAHKRDPEPGRSRCRHATYFAGLGEPDRLDALERPGANVFRQRLTRDLDNLLAAFRYATESGDAERATWIALAAWEVVQQTGPLSLGQELLGPLETLETSPEAEARRCELAVRVLGGPDLTEAVFEQALVAYRRTGSRRGEGSILRLLGWWHFEALRLEACEEALEAALSKMREAGDVAGWSKGMGVLGLLRRRQGRFDEAQELFEASLRTRSGYPRAAATNLSYLGGLYFLKGNYEDALRHMSAARDLHESLGNRRSIGMVLGNLGAICDALGDGASADAHYADALAIHRLIGNRRMEGITLHNQGHLYERREQLEDARETVERALSIHIEVHNVQFEASANIALARIAAKGGRTDVARVHLSRAEPALVEVQASVEWLRLLAARCMVEFEEGQRDVAFRTCDAVEAWVEENGHSREQSEGQRTLRLLQDFIGREP